MKKYSTGMRIKKTGMSDGELRIDLQTSSTAEFDIYEMQSADQICNVPQRPVVKCDARLILPEAQTQVSTGERKSSYDAFVHRCP